MNELLESGEGGSAQNEANPARLPVVNDSGRVERASEKAASNGARMEPCPQVCGK